MKKNFVVVLALVFVLGIAGTAFAAANPFVDVPAKHWAYEAVSKLAAAGIVDGYGDGTFRGDKTLTRYEMAQIVAKAMAKSDKANAQQKATIDKLAVEFAAELNNLGVRVAKLEKNQPNVKFTGDYRTRYTVVEPEIGAGTGGAAQYRLRLDGVAKVDDKTTANFRFVTREPDKGSFGNDTWQTYGKNLQDGANYANIDRIFFTTKFGQTTTVLGRQSFWLDAQGAFVDSGAFSYDGLKASTKLGDFTVAGTWGRFLSGATWAGAATPLNTYAKDLDIAGLSVAAKVGKLDYNLGYTEMRNPVAKTSPFKWTVLNTNYLFDSKFALNGIYLHNGSDIDMYAGKSATAWALRATYGNQKIGKKGDNNLVVQYVDKGANASPNNLMGIGNSTGKDNNQAGFDFTQLDFQYNYGFSKSFISTLEYTIVSPDGNAAAGAENKMYRAIVTVLF